MSIVEIFTTHVLPLIFSGGVGGAIAWLITIRRQISKDDFTSVSDTIRSFRQQLQEMAAEIGHLTEMNTQMDSEIKRLRTERTSNLQRIDDLEKTVALLKSKLNTYEKDFSAPPVVSFVESGNASAPKKRGRAPKTSAKL